ncbi:MAG: hypothetical protein NXI24_13665 [bacterium]|nr:hypothetical protein [bacterium]
MHLAVLAATLLIAGACRVDRKLDNPSDKIEKVSCNASSHFVDNLCDDEVEYLKWAEELKDYPRLEDLNREALYKITQETQDVDKAAAVFYTRVLRDPKNKKFYEYLKRKEAQLKDTTPDYSDLNLLLALVPGAFYADNPNVGADGSKLRELVVKMGMQEDLIEVEQTGSVERNADIICDYLKRRDDVDGIILASVSKGSSDIKVAVSKCGNEDYFKKVIGWYNIGGINKGSVLVNALNDDWTNKWEARTYFCLQGYDWEGMQSIRANEGAPLDFDVKLPPQILLINVVGVPTFRFVTNRARPFYEYLIRYGPNDGVSLLSDTFMPGGITWASWRNDHYFRWPITEAKMQAFVVYIVENRRAELRKLRAAR